MEGDQEEDQKLDCMTISRRFADFQWLGSRERRRKEGAGGVLFSGPRQFELERLVDDDDDS